MEHFSSSFVGFFFTTEVNHNIGQTTFPQQDTNFSGDTT